MINIVNYFRGSVRAELTSEYPERFINVCAQNNIAIWDLERVDSITLRASMHSAGFKKLLPFAGRGIGQLKLAKRTGLPFFLLRFKKRYALALSTLLTAGVITALSMFVWEIEVTGNKTVSGERILNELAELGVGVGTYRRSISPSDLQNHMLLVIPELSWLTVNVKGSRATVEVREAIPKPEIVPRDVPCNIVSNKAGLIVSMNTLEGAPQVKVGQAVEEGQLLVSGLINSNIIGMRQVHAMADIRARTWYEYTSVMPLNATGKRYTGNEKKHHSIIVAGYRINFFTRQAYDHCDIITERKTLRLGESFALPFTWVTETMSEYVPTEYTVSHASANAFMRNALGARLFDESRGGEVISVEAATTISNGVYKCEMVAECLERVAKTMLIP